LRRIAPGARQAPAIVAPGAEKFNHRAVSWPRSRGLFGAMASPPPPGV